MVTTPPTLTVEILAAQLTKSVGVINKGPG